MSVLVREPGLQTTIQAAPRHGLRHLGVPTSGAADALSLALANRLVGNRWSAPALEATLIGPTVEFERDALVALAGARAEPSINGKPVEDFRVLELRSGDTLEVGPVNGGARVYVGVAGGFAGDNMLGSESTYLPAGLGGFHGRALRTGDRVRVRQGPAASDGLVTPDECRPHYSGAYVLRTCPGAESGLLDPDSARQLYTQNWQVGRRADRMGLQLEGASLVVDSDGRMPSAPVFPGTLQCPEAGTPILLGVDAQTTGGYPRVLQVIRADRHLLGQLRPGDHVRFVGCDPGDAAADLLTKHQLWLRWLPDIANIL